MWRIPLLTLMTLISRMKVLSNVTDVEGQEWKLVLVWARSCPIWCYSVEDAEVLCWGGFENAIGWKQESTDS